MHINIFLLLIFLYYSCFNVNLSKLHKSFFTEHNEPDPPRRPLWQRMFLWNCAAPPPPSDSSEESEMAAINTDDNDDEYYRPRAVAHERLAANGLLNLDTDE